MTEELSRSISGSWGKGVPKTGTKGETDLVNLGPLSVQTDGVREPRDDSTLSPERLDGVRRKYG